MIWTRRLMRTALVFSIMMTILANESDAEIRAEWTQLTVAQPMGRVNALETDGRRLYAGTWNGVYISLDDGYTWGSSEVKHTCTAIAIHQNTVYAGTHGNGVVRSDNLGETWKPINDGLPLYEELDQYGRVEQILVTSSGTVITVTCLGTYTSTDRGETWHGVIDDWIVRQDAWGAPDWPIARSILSMTEFDGYLWSEADGSMFRSPDNGHTWESIPRFGHHPAHDWAVFNDRIIRRRRLRLCTMERRRTPFPLGVSHRRASKRSDGYLDYAPSLTSLAVNRGRLFAGLYDHGVYMFDARSDTWIPAGLQWLTVSALVSHQSELYAATYALHERQAGTVHTPQGIYRATILTVQPYGKAATTWGAVKQEVPAK